MKPGMFGMAGIFAPATFFITLRVCSNCFIILLPLPIVCLREISCWTKSGALIILVIHVRWMCMLSVCAKSWRESPNNGA